MDVKVHSALQAQPAAQEAAKQISKCVHCGFCLPACPTYGLDQDERSSPRGRIYLVKELLEGTGDPATLRRHLDGCLSCRACETACPSGVDYSRIAHFGRNAAERELPRSRAARFGRSLIHTLVRSKNIGRLARLGGRLSEFFPSSPLSRGMSRPLAQRKMPIASDSGDPVILLEGCAQAGLMPSTNTALSKLLTLAGYEVMPIAGQCCGALASHMGMKKQASTAIRSLLLSMPRKRGKKLPPIVASASGCASFLREYPHLDMPRETIAQSLKLASAVVDPVILLEERKEKLLKLRSNSSLRVAVHDPCTQTNGLGMTTGNTASLLKTLGFEAVSPMQPPNCCGSAGSYSLLNPEPAGRLRSKMVDSLEAVGCDMIVSSNIGCILHLRQSATLPVHHWSELIAAKPKLLNRGK